MAETPIRITSTSEIQDFRKKIKEKCGKVESNFTVFPQTVKEWIDEGRLSYVEIGSVVYLILESERDRVIYFFSDSFQSLSTTIDKLSLILKVPSVLEIVTKEEVNPLVKNPSMTLLRMSSTSIPAVVDNDYDGTLSAQRSDVDDLENILTTSFDPIAERVPTKRDLKKIIADSNSGGIEVIRRDGKIIGVMIYSIDPTTIHLRYWWTDPLYRGQNIGGRLLKKFFYLGQRCKRMILWVSLTNDNAIKRYTHYGFNAERMYDHIYKINCV